MKAFEQTTGDEMKIGAFRTAVGFYLLVLLTSSGAAQAAEIKLFAAAGFRAVVNAIAPEFERMTGHKLVATFEATGPLRRMLNDGESFDVIVAPDLVDDLVKQGKLDAGTRADIARAGVGLAMREGASKPDIASIDAFKSALLNAKSVSYAGEGFSGEYFLGLLKRLSIAEEMKPKLKPMAAAAVIKASASGEVEFAVFAIPGILAERGAQLVGPLPPALQMYAELKGGVSTTAKEPEAARAFMRFLGSDAAAVVIRARGWEPAPR
jgi:molybdate transport system substrate-binding protein